MKDFIRWTHDRGGCGALQWQWPRWTVAGTRTEAGEGFGAGARACRGRRRSGPRAVLPRVQTLFAQVAQGPPDAPRGRPTCRP